MNKLAIPYDALVFVGDGRKALFLRNDVDEEFPNLKTEQVFADENPPTHEQGADKPGTAFGRAGAHRRSSVEQTDWHHLEEHRFVERVAAALENVVRSRAVPVACHCRTAAHAGRLQFRRSRRTCSDSRAKRVTFVRYCADADVAAPGGLAACELAPGGGNGTLGCRGAPSDATKERNTELFFSASWPAAMTMSTCSGGSLNEVSTALSAAARCGSS